MGAEWRVACCSSSSLLALVSAVDEALWLFTALCMTTAAAASCIASAVACLANCAFSASLAAACPFILSSTEPFFASSGFDVFFPKTGMLPVSASGGEYGQRLYKYRGRAHRGHAEPSFQERGGLQL